LTQLDLGLEQNSNTVDGGGEISDFNQLEWDDDISDAEVLPSDEPAYLTPIAVIDDPRYKASTHK